MTTTKTRPRLDLKSKFPQLRDYQGIVKSQSDALDTNHVIQMPTGTGKGNLLLDIALESLSNYDPTLIVVPSIDLVENLKERLDEYCPMASRICSCIGTGYKGSIDKPFVIGVYKSISSRLDNIPYFKTIIHDEVHHSNSPSWQKIIKAFARSKHIGFTATPTRLDGRPLGDNFQDLVTSPSVRWFIDNGYLSDYELETIASIKLSDSSNFDDNLALQQKLLDNKELRADIVKNWMSKAYGKKTLVYSSGITHAFHLRDEFNVALEGTGLRFEVVHSNNEDYKMSTLERVALIKDFKSGNLCGLINVAIVTEGVDIPNAEVCILARYTYSLSLYLQMVGRVLRFVLGKKALIFDHAGNAITHGMPCYDHDWTLLGSEIKQIDNRCLCIACEMPLIAKSKVAKFGDEGIDVECPNCGYLNHFTIIPEMRAPRVQIPGLDDGELVKMSVDPQEYRIYKILASNRTAQDKREAILKTKASEDTKIMGLLRLDMDQRSAMFYLDLFNNS